MTITARRVEGTRLTPARSSHILRHPLAFIPAIGASYANYISPKMSFRSDEWRNARLTVLNQAFHEYCHFCFVRQPLFYLEHCTGVGERLFGPGIIGKS